MTRDEAMALNPGDEVLVRAVVVTPINQPYITFSVKIKCFEEWAVWLTAEDIHSLAPPLPPEPLKAGDAVVTIGGYKAVILAVDDDWAWIKDGFGHRYNIRQDKLTRKATP